MCERCLEDDAAYYWEKLREYSASEYEEESYPEEPRRRNNILWREEKMPEIEAVRTGGQEKELLTFRVKRSVDGLKIMAKSEVLAKFFAGFKDPVPEGDSGVSKVTKWSGLSISKMTKLPQLADATFDRPGDFPIIGDYVVNLTWLRSPDLGKGIEFVIKGPFSSTQAKNFYLKTKDAVKELFNEYLEDTDMEYTLTGRSSL